MKDRSIGVIPVKIERGKFLFLLVQEIRGYWGFPKGHPESGESETETALRELNEETDINKCEILSGFRYVQKYTFQIDENEFEKEAVFFVGLVEKEKESLNSTEIRCLKWLNFEDSLEQLTYEESRQMLKEAFEFLKDLK